MGRSQPRPNRTDRRFPRVSGDEPDHSTNIRDDLEFSRVSGDEPRCDAAAARSCLFSPRERG